MNDIIEIMAERYFPYAVGDQRLEDMLAIMVAHSEDWPVDKLNRWLGFVQGCLFMEGKIDIFEEREFTRPLFHKYYEENGIEIPESIEV